MSEREEGRILEILHNLPEPDSIMISGLARNRAEDRIEAMWVVDDPTMSDGKKRIQLGTLEGYILHSITPDLLNAVMKMFCDITFRRVCQNTEANHQWDPIPTDPYSGIAWKRCRLCGVRRYVG